MSHLNLGPSSAIWRHGIDLWPMRQVCIRIGCEARYPEIRSDQTSGTRFSGDRAVNPMMIAPKPPKSRAQIWSAAEFEELTLEWTAPRYTSIQWSWKKARQLIAPT